MPGSSSLRISILRRKLTNRFGSYKSPLQFYDGRPVRSAAEWPARRKEILQYWHKALGPWPPLTAKPKIEYLEQKQRETFSQQRIRVEIAPEQTPEAYLLIPQGEGPFPAVLVPFYEPETSIGLKKPLLDFGYQLTKRGFITLSIGSPGGRRPQTGGRPGFVPTALVSRLRGRQLLQRAGISPKSRSEAHRHCWSFLWEQVGHVRFLPLRGICLRGLE